VVEVPLCQPGAGFGGRGFEKSKGILLSSPYGQQIYHYLGMRRRGEKIEKGKKVGS
jgi:hypothetical protein